MPCKLAQKALQIMKIKGVIKIMKVITRLTQSEGSSQANSEGGLDTSKSQVINKSFGYLPWFPLGFKKFLLIDSC